MQLLIVGFVMSLVLAATALPFSKDSGVVELTPQSLPGFLNTHKPVFIMFYAPWCGHCKSAHPEWEKFAKGVKDVVKVGALDADKYRDIGGQFGIKGFPTIKYWKIGSKKGKQPLDYQGQRSHGAFHNAALAEITAQVTTATSLETVKKELSKAGLKKAVVLFSSKTKSPPMFSVLSHSPHFSGKVAFVLVNEKLSAVVNALGAKSFPSLALVSFQEGSEELSATFYDGKLEYTPIAKFVQTNVLGVDVPEDTEPAKVKPEVKKYPASPVRPVPLTAEGFKTFCGPDAPKVRQQQPFCVVAFQTSSIKFEDIHGRFSNEAVHFLTAPEDSANAKRWVSEMSDALQPNGPLQLNDVVILRFAKDRTKFVVFRIESDDHAAQHFEGFLERAFAGDTTFNKNPGFPKLSP